MNLKINFPNLARQLLPNHKRLPNMLCVLRALMSPLADMFAGFDKWRDDTRVAMNMTGQAGVLEGYLRAKYNDKRIKVATLSDRGLTVGLPFEGRENAVRVGSREESVSVAVPLPSDTGRFFGNVDFIVAVPVEYDEAAVEKICIDTERYKVVLTNYKIVKR